MTTTPPCPLPVLPALSRLEPAALRVSTTRMDRSGRVHERILLRELGWEPGRRLDMDTLHGMILIATTPSGRHRVDRRGAIVLPRYAVCTASTVAHPWCSPQLYRNR